MVWMSAEFKKHSQVVGPIVFLTIDFEFYKLFVKMTLFLVLEMRIVMKYR